MLMLRFFCRRCDAGSSQKEEEQFERARAEAG